MNRLLALDFVLRRTLIIGISFIFFSPIAWSQSSEENASLQKVKIILDTDMGSDCDDVGALALLHAYADEGKVEIIGCIYSSGKVPYGAGIIEAINSYYGRPKIPIGATHLQIFGDSIDKMLAEKLVRDTTAFNNSIIKNTDTQEQTQLNRKLLVESEDTSITYVTIGHTKGLYDLLRSEPDDISPLSGHELIKNKMKRWVALGAKYANNKKGTYTKDWNFYFNDAARYTKYLIDRLPTKKVFIAGTKAKTGKSLKHTPPGNIVRTAYLDWLWNWEKKTLDDQRHSSDLMAVHYAVEGVGDILWREENGYLDFDIEKGCRWIISDSFSNQFFINQLEHSDQAYSDYLNELISRLPRHTADMSR